MVFLLILVTHEIWKIFGQAYYVGLILDLVERLCNCDDVTCYCILDAKTYLLLSHSLRGKLNINRTV